MMHNLSLDISRRLIFGPSPHWHNSTGRSTGRTAATASPLVAGSSHSARDPGEHHSGPAAKTTDRSHLPRKPAAKASVLSPPVPSTSTSPSSPHNQPIPSPARKKQQVGKPLRRQEDTLVSLASLSRYILSGGTSSKSASIHRPDNIQPPPPTPPLPPSPGVIQPTDHSPIPPPAHSTSFPDQHTFNLSQDTPPPPLPPAFPQKQRSLSAVQLLTALPRLSSLWQSCPKDDSHSAALADLMPTITDLILLHLPTLECKHIRAVPALLIALSTLSYCSPELVLRVADVVKLHMEKVPAGEVAEMLAAFATLQLRPR